jgi:ABC-type Fe3+-hydroxamate transport system substrate-binding protein
MQRTVTDQLLREITFSYPPKRIVSLVPSLTELLFDLGLDEEVVGLTKFCIHPIDKFARCIKVGGTKKLNIELIKEIKPDLIIANKEENTMADVDELADLFPVWVSDINTLEDAKQTILQIGELIDRQPEASYLIHLISAGFSDLQTLALERGIDKKVAYLIWKKPYMAAGINTYISDILELNGMRNVVKSSRYPQLDLSELAALNPDLVFLSSEPYPFIELHVQEIQNVLPKAKIMLVDGEMFSWYGSRLVKAVQYFFEFQKEISVK